jgi:hypothetical protein
MQRSSGRTDSRSMRSARITEGDILNCALEMFCDDLAASIGVVLENDEVARLQALELVPRRTERRAEETESPGSGVDSARAGVLDKIICPCQEHSQRSAGIGGADPE